MSRLIKLLSALLLIVSSGLLAIPAHAVVISQNTSVTLNGSPAIGGTITSMVENQPAGAVLSYKWTIGTATVGNQSSLPISNNAWSGKKVTLTVTSSATGYKPYKYVSPALNIGSFTIFGNTGIYPSARAGTTQTVTNHTATFPVYFDASGRAQVTYTHQWYLDSQPIDGATASSIEVTDLMIGKVLRADQTLHFTGLPDKVLQTSYFTVQGQMTRESDGVISSNFMVGETITLTSAPVYSPAGTKTTYAWLRNGSAIKSATKSSYKLTSSDWHKTISLRITTSRNNYSTETFVTPGNYILKEGTKTGSTINGYDSWDSYESFDENNAFCLQSGTNAKWFGCLNSIETVDDFIYVSLQMANPTPVNASLIRWKVKVVGISSMDLEVYALRGSGTEYVLDDSVPFDFSASKANKDTTWTTGWSTEIAGVNGNLNIGLAGFDTGSFIIKSVQVTATYSY